MSSTRPWAIVVLAALIIGACSSSAKKADPAADLAAAKAAVLTAADLPGYTAKPYTKSSDIPAADKKAFATCMHTTTSFLDDVPGSQTAHSPDFSNQAATLSSSIEIDPNLSSIDNGWNVLTKHGIEGCFQQLFASALKEGSPSGVTFGAATVTKFDVGIGSRSIGFEAKLPASTKAGSIVAFADVVFVARDRAGIQLDAENISQPFDRAQEIALAQTMYDRLGTKAK